MTTGGPSVASVRGWIERLESWSDKSGLATYDPFDIKATKLSIWTYGRSNPGRAVVRRSLNGLELFFPVLLRKAMRVRKKPSAGGTARYAQAQVALYRLDGDQRHIDKAREALDWLLANPAGAHVGQGWGLPFDWQTFFATVPAGTALSHTTQGCGNAFLDYFDATGDDWAKEAAEGCCEFLTGGLNRTVRDSGAVALSYTPLDTSQVANTNAEVAAFLVRCGRPQDQELARQVARFVCEAQNADGSWFYSAPGSVTGSNPIDNYHTGMLVSGLTRLADDEQCRTALNKGLEFHLDNHFLDDGCPKFRPDSVYPVDSYSAGQSVLSFIEAARCPYVDAPLKARSAEALDRLVGYVVTNFIGFDGATMYRRYRWSTMRIGSMRWAHALLTHALAEYCLSKTADGSG